MTTRKQQRRNEREAQFEAKMLHRKLYDDVRAKRSWWLKIEEAQTPEDYREILHESARRLGMED